jgi:hypothetical protein
MMTTTISGKGTRDPKIQALRDFGCTEELNEKPTVADSAPGAMP